MNSSGVMWMSLMICRSRIAREIARAVIGDGGCAAVGMAELFVGAFLADFDEAEGFEDAANFAGLEDGEAGHLAFHGHRLRANKFGLELRFAVFEEHLNHLPKIPMQLVQCGTLGMRAGEAGDVADEQAGLGIAFDDGGVRSH
jgi:hypothetical protein